MALVATMMVSVDDLAASDRSASLADALAVAQQRLDDSISRFQALIASFPAAVLVEDQDRHIVLTNGAFTHLFGIDLPPVALLGADCSQAAEQSKHLFADPDGFVASVDRALAGRTPVLAEELTMADGRIVERDYVPVYRDAAYLGHSSGPSRWR